MCAAVREEELKFSSFPFLAFLGITWNVLVQRLQLRDVVGGSGALCCKLQVNKQSTLVTDQRMYVTWYAGHYIYYILNILGVIEALICNTRAGM